MLVPAGLSDVYATGDTVTVGGAERQGKSNPLQSDYILLVLQTLLYPYRTSGYLL